jgi:hypothetical protein
LTHPTRRPKRPPTPPATTPLVVLRVEPVVICRTPDDEEITLFAYEVQVVEDKQ